MGRPKTKFPDDLIGQTLVIESPEPLKIIKTGGDGLAHVGAYAIKFSGPDQKDLSGEYFTAQTDYGPRNGDGVATMFHHGLPLADGLEYLAYKTFAPVKALKDDIGIFVETVLNLSDEYEAAIADLVNAGKLKWSSGTSYHLARKSADGQILRWHPIEFSYTPTPAESRLPKITPLKSIALDDNFVQEVKSAFEKNDHFSVIEDDSLTAKQTQMDTKDAEIKIQELESNLAKALDTHRSELAERDSKVAEIAAQNAALTEEVETLKKAQVSAAEEMTKRLGEVSEMYALGYQFGNVAAAKEFVGENKSCAEFRTHLLDVLKAKPVIVDVAVNAKDIANRLNEITDPAERTEFFRKNAEAIHAANRQLKK